MAEPTFIETDNIQNPELDKILFQKIAKIPYFDHMPVKNIKFRRFGGGTNVPYLIEADDRLFILRFQRSSLSDVSLFECHLEYNNVNKIAPLQIGVEIVYFNQKDGTFLMPYIDNIKKLDKADYENSEILKQLIGSLKKLHFSNIMFDNDVDFFEKLFELYDILIEKKPEYISENIKNLYSKFCSLYEIYQKLNIKKYPCHNDLSPFNTLLTEKGVVFVDWERSGNNDPAWDLAYLANCAHLKPAQEKLMFEVYGDHDAFLEKRFLFYKPVVEFWKSLWMIFQILNESDILSAEGLLAHSQQRAESCKRLLNQESFQNIVLELDLNLN